MSNYLPSDDSLTYQILLQQLQDLNAKINTFVNGDASTLIPTANGNIMTLAGIEATALKPQYVQTVFDVTTYQYIVDNLASYNVGNLFRVTADPNPTLNGLYIKDTLTTFVKARYADLVSLVRQLPDPWDYDYLAYDETTTTSQKHFASISLPIQSVNFSVTSFELDFGYKIDNNSIYKGYYVYRDVTVAIAALDSANWFIDIKTPYGVLTTPVRPDAYTTIMMTPVVNHFTSSLTLTTQPSIIVNHTLSGGNHVFDLYLVPPTDVNSTNVSGNGSMTFRGIDKTVVTLIK